ncbi:DUF6538 domain-containing protein [Xanthomonas sp. WHRI 7945]|nr:DUF6538 domain-containing protein [Xanthomonas campestris pv. campestris]
MRVAHYLTRGETGRYYVRLRIPADLQARFGRKVVKRSTGTTCDRAALGYALPLQQRVAQAFAVIRNGSMGSELDELLRSLEGTRRLSCSTRAPTRALAARMVLRRFGRELQGAGRLPLRDHLRSPGAFAPGSVEGVERTWPGVWVAPGSDSGVPKLKAGQAPTAQRR